MIQYYTESLSLGFLKLWEDEHHKVQIKNNFCRSITGDFSHHNGFSGILEAPLP